eukprot:366260-Chlamydomonas_euryale.AAC.20
MGKARRAREVGSRGGQGRWAVEMGSRGGQQRGGKREARVLADKALDDVVQDKKDCCPTTYFQLDCTMDRGWARRSIEGTATASECPSPAPSAGSPRWCPPAAQSAPGHSKGVWGCGAVFRSGGSSILSLVSHRGRPSAQGAARGVARPTVARGETHRAAWRDPQWRGAWRDTQSGVVRPTVARGETHSGAACGETHSESLPPPKAGQHIHTDRLDGTRPTADLLPLLRGAAQRRYTPEKRGSTPSHCFVWRLKALGRQGEARMHSKPEGDAGGGEFCVRSTHLVQLWQHCRQRAAAGGRCRRRHAADACGAVAAAGVAVAAGRRAAHAQGHEACQQAQCTHADRPGRVWLHAAQRGSQEGLQYGQAQSAQRTGQHTGCCMQTAERAAVRRLQGKPHTCAPLCSDHYPKGRIMRGHQRAPIETPVAVLNNRLQSTPPPRNLRCLRPPSSLTPRNPTLAPHPGPGAAAWSNLRSEATAARSTHCMRA